VRGARAGGVLCAGSFGARAVCGFVPQLVVP
jgi:hypothetical protein